MQVGKLERTMHFFVGFGAEVAGDSLVLNVFEKM